MPVRQVAVFSPYGYITDAQYVDHRNNFRIPPSHRLNIGCNLHKERRRGESIWNFSVYNAYNRMNPNFVFMDYGPDYDNNGNYSGTSLKMKKITILPLLPSVSWTRNF